MISILSETTADLVQHKSQFSWCIQFHFYLSLLQIGHFWNWTQTNNNFFCSSYFLLIDKLYLRRSPGGLRALTSSWRPFMPSTLRPCDLCSHPSYKQAHDEQRASNTLTLVQWSKTWLMIHERSYKCKAILEVGLVGKKYWEVSFGNLKIRWCSLLAQTTSRLSLLPTHARCTTWTFPKTFSLSSSAPNSHPQGCCIRRSPDCGEVHVPWHRQCVLRQTSSRSKGKSTNGFPFKVLFPRLRMPCR